MKTKSLLNILVISLALGAMACRPAPKSPPFSMGFVRQDSKVDSLPAEALEGPASIGADQLWKKTTGKMPDGTRVRVAIIGTGIDYTVPDLREALWINPAELGEKKWNNGLDDDDNGFEDDIIGYDFYSGIPLPYDWHGHDTFVASVIAATGHANPKVIGIAPNAELMILRYLGSDGTAARDHIGFDAAIAFDYAIRNGAKVIYFNWPQGGFNKMQTALLMAQLKEAEARNIVVVLPAGNSANQEIPQFIKDAAQMKNTLVVAGAEKSGKLTKTTNSGRIVASIAAPVDARGYYPTGIVATDLKTSSVAAAYVAGSAALLASLPNFGSASKIRDALLMNAAKVKDGDLADVLAEGTVSLAGF